MLRNSNTNVTPHPQVLWLSLKPEQKWHHIYQALSCLLSDGKEVSLTRHREVSMETMNFLP
jgi:hypothetical protein